MYKVFLSEELRDKSEELPLNPLKGTLELLVKVPFRGFRGNCIRTKLSLAGADLHFQFSTLNFQLNNDTRNSNS